MKLVVAFMAGIAVAHALVTCPDKEFQCPDGNTCCKMEDGEYGCCPMASAVCCKDGTHCCPHGTTCDTEKGRCNSATANMLLFVLKSQRYLTKGATRPATVVESKPAEPVQIMESGSALFIVEEGGHRCNETKTCPWDTTCCQNGGDTHTNTWGCCPFDNGVCCNDRRHCCPEGTVCGGGGASCWTPPMAKINSLLEKASEKQLPLLPSIHQKMVPFTVVESKPTEPVQIMESGSAMFIVEEGSHRCNETKTCPGDTTCCNNGGHTNTWGCCPYENGVCCADRMHCCPEGSVCDVKASTCRAPPSTKPTAMESEEQNQLAASFREKMVPATNVPQLPMPYMNCNFETQTMCNSVGSQWIWGCCPFAEAVCCPDRTTCCPGGTECATKEGWCTGNRSLMVENFFRLIDSRTAIPRKRVNQQEEEGMYSLLGDNYGQDQV